MFAYILTILILILLSRILFLKTQVRLFIDGFNAVIEVNFVYSHKKIIFKRIIRIKIEKRHFAVYLLGKKTDEGYFRRKKKNKKEDKPKYPTGEILDSIELKDGRLSIELGLGRADKTAIWSGIIAAYFSVKNKKNSNDKNRFPFRIYPNFKETCFRAEGKCIIKIRVVHIIYVLLTKRSKKNGQTSDRKHHDNNARKFAEHG